MGRGGRWQGEGEGGGGKGEFFPQNLRDDCCQGGQLQVVRGIVPGV